MKEAAYFLTALKTSQDREKFDFNLSAFLSALSSVLDVILFDLSEKYSLGFGRNDRLDESGFEIAARTRARVLDNEDAMNFLRWWRRERGKLLKGPYGPLHRKRIQIVHKGYLDVERRHVLQLSEIVNMSASDSLSLTWQLTGTAGAHEVETRPESKIAIPPTPQSKFEIYFPDIPDRSAIDVCTEAFREVENLVERAEKGDWPIKPPDSV